MHSKQLALVLAAVLFAAPAVAGETANASGPAPACTLTRLASLDITTLPDGQIAVPIGINGTDRPFIVFLQDASAITDDLANELDLRRSSTAGRRGYSISIGGRQVTEIASVPSMQIGMVHSTDVDMFVLSRRYTDGSIATSRDDVASGMIGTSLLSHFDVEFDFKANKLNLYAPASCGLSSVYWASSAAAIPFTRDVLGNPVFHMQLDGKDVSALLSLYGSPASMDTNDAEKLLGITQSSPGFEPLAPTEYPSNVPSDRKYYKYPFKTLAVGGLTINNPQVLLYSYTPNKKCGGKSASDYICYGGAELEVGLNELRQLHLYFSFASATLYVTAADAHK